MDDFERQMMIDNGFDTDAKRALRAVVLQIIHPDASLWEACWEMTDAYGEPGFIPPQGYDWSGFRDSTYSAIAEMAVRLRAHTPIAMIAQHLGLLPAETEAEAEAAAFAHRAADPHCTCNDCMAVYIDGVEAAQKAAAAQIFDRVAEALTAAGTPACAEYSGGGIVCVYVEAGAGRRWAFGTANETWGGELLDAEGYVADEGTPEGGHFIETRVDSASEDAEAIAAALRAALREAKDAGL